MRVLYGLVKYPLLVMSNHGRWRVHAQCDDITWTREAPTCKVKGNKNRSVGGSALPLRGYKFQQFEGGMREPTVMWWPGRIPAGSVADHISAFWDVMPTLAEIAGVEPACEIDGISLLPTLLAREGQRAHEYLYWEYFGRPAQAVRMGDWKGIRLHAKKNPRGPIELYNLAEDLGEERNVAAEHPWIVEKIEKIMAYRTPSEFSKWNFEQERP